jgi:hypothetical protein
MFRPTPKQLHDLTLGQVDAHLAILFDKPDHSRFPSAGEHISSHVVNLAFSAKIIKTHIDNGYGITNLRLTGDVSKCQKLEIVLSGSQLDVIYPSITGASFFEMLSPGCAIPNTGSVFIIAKMEVSKDVFELNLEYDMCGMPELDPELYSQYIMCQTQHWDEYVGSTSAVIKSRFECPLLHIHVYSDAIIDAKLHGTICGQKMFLGDFTKIQNKWVYNFQHTATSELTSIATTCNASRVDELCVECTTTESTDVHIFAKSINVLRCCVFLTSIAYSV